jgi:hypothetical protein
VYAGIVCRQRQIYAGAEKNMVFALIVQVLLDYLGKDVYNRYRL